jgi:putative ABC transport system permease protein
MDGWSNFLQPTYIRETLKENVPGIKSVSCIKIRPDYISINNRQIRIRLCGADSSFFNMFDSKLIEGSMSNFNTNTNTAVITKRLADKLVKNNNYSSLIGSKITFQYVFNQTFSVSAIIEDNPQLSSFDYDIAIKENHVRGGWDNYVGTHSAYVLTNNNSNIETIRKTLNNNIKSIYAPLYEENKTDSYRVKELNNHFNIKLVPLNEMYLNKNFEIYAYEKKGNSTYSYTLVVICGIVLLLSIINYLMLVLGLYAKRYKELAIKKVSGSNKILLIIEFIIEVIITYIISTIIAFFIINQLIPYIENFSNITLVINPINTSHLFIFIIILLIIIISCLLFPAILVSKLNPTEIFRNKSKLISKTNLSKSFLILQYFLIMFLVCASYFVNNQFQFLLNKDLGFNTDQILMANLPYTFNSFDRQAFINDIKPISDVEIVASTNRSFFNGYSLVDIVTPDSKQFGSLLIDIDENYINCLSLRVLDGKNFQAEDMDKPKVIINQKFADDYGLKHPIGEFVKIIGIQYEIIGVINNFHYESLDKKIKPMSFIYTKEGKFNKRNDIFIKTKHHNYSAIQAKLKGIWQKHIPQRDYDIDILKRNFEEVYNKEKIWVKILFIITVLSIFVSSMGIAGLSIMILNNKRKEIGVRVVNGARFFEIFKLINTSFIKQLSIAAIVSIPVIIYTVNEFLNSYNYRTELSYITLSICLLIVSCFVLTIITWQIVRLMRQNPIKSLKYE